MMIKIQRPSLDSKEIRVEEGLLFINAIGIQSHAFVKDERINCVRLKYLNGDHTRFFIQLCTLLSISIIFVSCDIDEKI